MKITNVQKSDIKSIANKIIDILELRKISILDIKGEIGSGKTTLIKEICSKMNILNYVNSPTYSIVNEYITINNEIIYHFDFYRINNIEEAEQMGITEYLESNNLCILEWSENVKDIIPIDKIEVYITVNQDFSRDYEIKK